MKINENRWVFGLLTIILIFVTSIWFFIDDEPLPVDNPWDGVPTRPAHVDHTSLIEGPLKSGPEVTAICLDCHEEAGDQVIHTAHWKWESEPVMLEGRDEPVTVGKKNSINNFCIGIQGNWESCTACHVGYGWEDENFDFTNQNNIDCLVCHGQSGTYKKGNKGLPVDGVNLLSVAQSVGVPNRENCGGCHFRGGGGNAVKHGDLDESLFFPSEDLDVHMGRLNFLCVDCHKTSNHAIGGRSTSVSLDLKNQIACTDCHNNKLHTDDRINSHTESLACQTCHIPALARKQASKTFWDWSQAGDPLREEDTHTYLKIKGSFIYEKGLIPEYRWFNGLADRYILGDKMDPDSLTSINEPKGDIHDPKAKIWPFKIHLAKQPFDSKLNHLLQPKTVGEGGYWTTFDWPSALELGAKTAGLEYSGEFGFTETSMHWPSTHMVAPKAQALQCKECHSPDGRMDWEALGFPGDPIKWGKADRNVALSKNKSTELEGDNNEN